MHREPQRSSLTGTFDLAAKGMDTRRLQHFLGHASITNTVRYTAMSPEPFKDVWR
jgi:site-specific recombinase XerD